MSLFDWIMRLVFHFLFHFWRLTLLKDQFYLQICFSLDKKSDLNIVLISIMQIYASALDCSNTLTYIDHDTFDCYTNILHL